MDGCREADTQSMHIRGTLPVCLLLSLFASQADAQFRAPEAPAPGESFHVELGLMFWKPTPGIVIGSDSLRTVNASGVDLVQQFGIENKRFNEFRTVLQGGKSKVRQEDKQYHADKPHGGNIAKKHEKEEQPVDPIKSPPKEKGMEKKNVYSLCWSK